MGQLRAMCEVKVTQLAPGKRFRFMKRFDKTSARLIPFAMMTLAVLFIFASINTARASAASIASAVLVDAGESKLPVPKIIQFNRDVRPILSDKCFACHGPDKKTRKGDLRLDTQEGIFNKVDNDYHIVLPKQLDDSELYARITSDDKKEQMPPRKFDKKLSQREVKIL